jgi:acetyl esterase/lipase
MNTISYQHNVPPSFESKLIQSAMGFFGMKKTMERRMMTNGFKKKPAKRPKSLSRNFNVREIQQNGRMVWTVSSKESDSDTVVLYLHGGAYMGNIANQHWSLIEQIIRKLKATIVIPDYPLAPDAGCNEAYAFIEVLYESLIIEYPAKRVIFMGDSAGGGMAFGFAQQLRNERKKQPDQIILFSPWLDVTMTNPKIALIEKEDKMLSIKGLKSAGQKYAGTLDLNDYRISPINGDLSGTGRISIFTGTNDLLNADAQKCKQLMEEQQISFNFFEYPKMFHDWMIITSLKESRDVIDKVYALVNAK